MRTQRTNSMLPIETECRKCAMYFRGVPIETEYGEEKTNIMFARLNKGKGRIYTKIGWTDGWFVNNDCPMQDEMKANRNNR